MSALKGLLEQVADEARLYDGTERAVRAMRRRRALIRLTPMAAGLVVLAAVGLSVVPRAVHRGPDPGPGSGVAGLPQQLSPTRSAPALPTDGAVGPATLAYRLRASIEDRGELRIVAADGRHYRLPEAERIAGISPDGRWLLWAKAGGRVVLRDLGGTQRREFGSDEVDGHVSAAWSPDSRRLVLQILNRPASDPTDRVILVVDLDPVRQRVVPVDGPAFPCAVRNSGDLILCGRVDVPAAGLQVADGATGRVRREFDPPAGLHPGEQIIANHSGLTADDVTLVVPVGLVDFGGIAVNRLAGIDLDTGRVTAWYALPQARPGAAIRHENGSITYGQVDRRELRGVADDGALVVHIVPRADDPSSGRAVAVELIAPDSGGVRVVTTVTGDIADVYLRGGNG